MREESKYKEELKEKEKKEINRSLSRKRSLDGEGMKWRDERRDRDWSKRYEGKRFK